jgi:hypothetical protein
MIPYEVDPSLHTEAPHEPTLDDGFSRPEAAHDEPGNEADTRPGDSPESRISEKSDF